MKVIHTSDIHLGTTRFGGPDRRRKVLERILTNFVSAASDINANLAVIAGDLFDTRRPHPRDWALATEFISRLSQVCPVVITDGNHDGKHIIRDEDSATLMSLQNTAWGNTVYVGLRPDVFLVGGAIVCVTPYPHKRSLDDDPSLQVLTPLQRMEEIAKRMDSGLMALHSRARMLQQQNVAYGHMPIILVGHLTAAGATVGSERGMRLEDDITISTDVLDEFDYCALGHLHKQQQVSEKAWYAGSPAFISWSEAGDPKGFLDVTVIPDSIPDVVHVPSGEGKMYDTNAGEAPSVVSDAYIRIHEHEGGAKADPSYLYGLGAKYVDVVREVREKAAPTSERALAVGTSPIMALDGYLQTKRPELDVAGRQRYTNAAAELMEDS